MQANRIVLGDCADVLPTLKKVHFVYMDPPFFTQKLHMMGDAIAFDDRWESIEQYVNQLAKRVRLAWGRLRRGGSLVVHVDPRSAWRVRAALAPRMEQHFASELVWRYRRWPAKTPNFQKVHDTLLRYVKPGAPVKWNQLFEPPAPSTLKVWGTKAQTAVVREGRRVRSKTGSQDSPGVAMGDVWDIGVIAPVSKERTGYPTQKPEALLTRLVEALTDPGDVVLDPYCGSGTTLTVAHKLQRRWVGIDSSRVAVKVARERMRNLAGY